MQKKNSLVLDTHCEVYDLLKPWADAEFWNFKEHVTDGKLVPGAVYVIGREQFTLNSKKIIELASENIIKVIFSNPSEGSETQINHCKQLHITDLILQKKMLMLTGGHVPEEYAALYYENFLPKILDYSENLEEIQQYQAQYSQNRPYKFLFLNGRVRYHRSYLLDQLKSLLDTAIWSNLDSGNGPIHLLQNQYELDRFNTKINILGQKCVKPQLFAKDCWGDIYIKALPYNHTYFSLVTETVFVHPYSFRTEKIWKPIAVGHPWIAASSRGYYKDIRNAGFQTFKHVIDESFDQIDNNQDRLERITMVVKDLCQQDLVKFLNECYNVCKYNQQHLAEMRVKVRKEFPDRFFQFLKQYKFDE
jgi:hypothetical protein